MTDNAGRMVQGLFEAYFEDISRLPPEFSCTG